MKLTIKTLDQKTFHVDFDESKTVWDLKAHLFKLPEVGVQPEQQQLIYAGRVLNNDQALKSYSIDERKFLVVMAKPAPQNQQNSNTPTTAKQEEAAAAATKPEKRESKQRTAKGADQPGPSPARKSDQQPQQLQATEEPSNTSTAAPSVRGDTPNSLAVNSLLQSVNQAPTAGTNDSLVREIMNMGYAEVDVRRALQASFNNPDRAIEYLIDGIPDFPETLAQPNEIVQGSLGPLSFLRGDPRFQQMRRIIQQRPELLSSVLAKIGESNPALLAIIREHQEEFVRMLNEGEDEPAGEPANIGDEVIEVVLTEGERMAVERLVSLGFPREIVVQAYIACDKNEEQTADFLFQHMEDN